MKNFTIRDPETGEFLQFIPLDKIIRQELKNPRFRKAYEKEMAALDLAHQVKSLREAKKLTQEQVAERADMPQSVIARLESGRHSASIATLQRVAQVFGRKITLSK